MEEKRVAAYVRVSTKSQNEEGQVAAINRYLAGNGIPPDSVCWYIDKASGSTGDRPSFQGMQEAIFMGEIDTVIVWKIDRLYRNYREGVNLTCDLLEKGIRLVSVTQGQDFCGPVGKLILGFLHAFAEIENDYRKERQAEGIAKAKERGAYKTVGRKKGTTKAKPARALKLREKGLTASEIATALGVSRNTVFDYFRKAKK